MNDRLAELADLQNKLVQIVYALGKRHGPTPVPQAACRSALEADQDVFKHVVDRLEVRELLNSSGPPGSLQLTGRGVVLARKLKQPSK